MIKINPLLLLLAGMYFISACNETDCSALNSFSGITERDESGKLIRADSKDWTFHDQWSDQEKGLFGSSYKTNCPPPSHFTIMAYPNPTDAQFNITVNKTDATRVELRLVDDDCTTFISLDEMRSNSIGLQPEGFKQHGLVRLYYKFIEDGCEYQGHGDIHIR